MNKDPGNGTNYQERVLLLRALSNPVRLQIVHTLLQSGRRNVGCMEKGSGVSQSCVSQHLQRLRTARIVTAERVGNEIFYKVSSRDAARLTAVLFNEEADRYVL